MSIGLQKEVWKLDLPPSEKLVLLRLADHANKDDYAYPSVRKLSNATGLSERQIQRYLKGFVEAGFVIVAEHDKGGRGNTKTYQFTFRKGDTDVTERETERVTPTTQKGDADDTVSKKKGDAGDEERVTPVTVKGDTFARANPEPSKNHQREPSTTQPMQRNGPAQTLVATLYEDVLGIGPPTGYKSVVGQAQMLVNAGCTPNELKAIAEWLQADPFWAAKGITMGLILSKRDNWRSASHAPATGQKSTARENDLDAWRRKNGLIPNEQPDAIEVNGGPR